MSTSTSKTTGRSSRTLLLAPDSPKSTDPEIRGTNSTATPIHHARNSSKRPYVKRHSVRSQFSPIFERIHRTKNEHSICLQGQNATDGVVNVDLGNGINGRLLIPIEFMAEFNCRFLELAREYSRAVDIEVTTRKSPEWSVDINLTIPSEPNNFVNGQEELYSLIFGSSDWCESEQLSKLACFSDKNLSSQPNKWKRSGRIFALRRGKKDVFPSYAFDENCRPLPAMKTVLSILHKQKSDLKVAAWFASCNSWLRGKRPLDLIGTDPDAVIKAAEIEVAPIDHG